MENIKDLKLIIGPLNAEQWKEVADWCDRNSSDPLLFKDVSSRASHIRFTAIQTEQGSLFISDDYSGHEKITYQQWYDRFIKKSEVLPERWAVKADANNYDILQEYFNKLIGRFPIDVEKRSYYHFPPCQGCCTSVYVESNYTEISFEDFKELILEKDVKQNKEEIMNTKQDFTIEGSIALRKAFVEECGIKTRSDTTISNQYSYLYPTVDNILQGHNIKADIHFILPQDWTKALEYVKEYFKEEPKFKAGDYITVIKNFPAEANISNLELGKTYKISESGTRVNDVPFKGLYDITNCFRPATPQEILDTLVKESGFKVGDNIESLDRDHPIKGVIKKFYVDVYVTKDTDDKFLYVTLEDGKSYVTTNFYGKPQFKLYNPTKTLVLGDKKIKVEISKGRIEAEGVELDINDLVDLRDSMQNDGTISKWDITYPQVKLGCTVFTIEEVIQVINTYEELND